MTLNSYFLQGSSSEQFLVQDLINEQLKIYGVEVFYLPRAVFRTDNILGEIESSKFDDSFVIEAYIDNYEGYAPDSDIMTKFGLRLKNEIRLVISRERFEDFISEFLATRNEAIDNDFLTDREKYKTITRPREGDLIYFPLGERLFEIKRVEHEKPFYQLGKTYIYELQCELYEYENEIIDTPIEEIDETIQDEGYITSLTLVGSSTTAVATAQISSGAINQIFLDNDGSGYTSTPTVEISSAPGGGTNATAVAITTTRSNITSVLRLELTNAGTGYTTAPVITISGGGGTGAAATCSIGGSTSKSVSSITISDKGVGYSINPVVTISGPGTGVTATAIARVDAETKIDSIRILNPGIGYTQAPDVSFAGFSTVGVGTFVYNETVTGQLSGTTAVVREYKITPATAGNPKIYNLRVAINNGAFSVGEIIVGSISSARYVISDYDANSYENSYDDNEIIEIEADNILDFTESNPFGNY